MTEHHESTPASTDREQELEIEIARLKAEIETLRGDDPAEVTSRFLTMAAETVDRAVADARREADEILVEISSEAEARRDEATRVAAEAEAMAEQLLADADRAQEAVEEANERAAAIKAEAEAEAEAMIAEERARIASEIDAVAEIRSALDEERAALESYHESLQRRVKELAASMVTFMHDELPMGGTGELVAVPLDNDEHVDEVFSAAAVDDDDDGDEMAATVEEFAAAPADEVADPWTEMLGAAIPEHDRIVDVPDSAIDEIPAGPPFGFGIPVGADDARPASGGLFSRMRSTADDELSHERVDTPDDGTDDDDDAPGLFGMLGSRVVQPTPPATLAEALDADDIEDQAFRQFLDGDDAPDPSRDWLLRPEQS